MHSLGRDFECRVESEIAMGHHVAILMATRNGDRFLVQQLETIASQEAAELELWISDDGSADRTPRILERLGKSWERGKVHVQDGPRPGFAENFRSLIVSTASNADYFAFCDQDDIWEEGKLAAALSWLSSQDAGRPSLFCTRTRLIDESGETIGYSPLFRREPCFRNAIVQSIAGGNTMVMNRAAFTAVQAASRRAAFVSHDWWCYQVVTGIGGTVHYSPTPGLGYRQHGANLVGDNSTWRARYDRVRRIAAGRFRDWNTINIKALEQIADMLTDDARQVLADFKQSREGSIGNRLAALRRSGAHRQRTVEQTMLYLACAMGKL